MSMSARRRLLLVALESTKGTYVGPTQAILAEDLKFVPMTETSPREGGGNYGGREYTSSRGPEFGRCTFKTYLKGTGGAALDAALAILLQGCGFTKSLETYTYYTSDYTSRKTISMGYYAVKGTGANQSKYRSMSGCQGKCTIEKTVPGNKAMLTFEFSGVWRSAVDATKPAFSPSVVAGMKASGFTIGGAAKKIADFNLDCGQNLVPHPNPNGTNEIDCFDVTDALPTLGVDPEEELVADKDYDGIRVAGTTEQIVSTFTDGTATATITMPKCEILTEDDKDRDKILALDLNYELLLSSGDDHITIAVA